MSHPFVTIPLDDLSIDERLALLDRVWDSVKDCNPLPLSEEQLEVIRQRRDDRKAGRSTVVSYEEYHKEFLEGRT